LWRERAKSDLRYDGKTFTQWRAVLRGDLSPTVRRDAMYALAEFAANGYGREATEAVFEAIRPYTASSSDLRERELMQAAFFAVTKAPIEDVLPSVREALKAENSNERAFALSVLPTNKAKDQIVPLLLPAVVDKDARVADSARTRLALVDHDHPVLINWLRAALAEGNVADAGNALSLLRQPQFFFPGQPMTTVAPFPALVPDVVKLLGHEKVSMRKQAADCLRGNREAAIPALEAEASKSATEATSIRARQLLDQFSSGAVTQFPWERQR
jgi:hypothetical protein